MESGLTHLDKGDGKTVAGFLHGVHARRPDRASRRHYMYFAVDESYASVGDHEIEVTVVARRVDPAKRGGCNLMYESTKGYRRTDEWWTVPARPAWPSHAGNPVGAPKVVISELNGWAVRTPIDASPAV